MVPRDVRCGSRVAAPGVVILLLGALCAAAAPAQPSDTASVRQARAMFLEGLDHFEAGDLDAALRSFRGSYELVRHPETLYNIAGVLSRLGRYREAIAEYDRYLAEGGDVPRDRRMAVAEELARLRGLLGLLELVVEPAGAAVSVDGAAAGTAPLDAPVAVDPDNDIVEPRLAGGRTPGRRSRRPRAALRFGIAALDTNATSGEVSGAHHEARPMAVRSAMSASASPSPTQVVFRRATPCNSPGRAVSPYRSRVKRRFHRVTPRGSPRFLWRQLQSSFHRSPANGSLWTRRPAANVRGSQGRSCRGSPCGPWGCRPGGAAATAQARTCGLRRETDSCAGMARAASTTRSAAPGKACTAFRLRRLRGAGRLGPGQEAAVHD
jgi:hypothetical protein